MLFCSFQYVCGHFFYQSIIDITLMLHTCHMVAQSLIIDITLMLHTCHMVAQSLIIDITLMLHTCHMVAQSLPQMLLVLFILSFPPHPPTPPSFRVWFSGHLQYFCSFPGINRVLVRYKLLTITVHLLGAVWLDHGCYCQADRIKK